MIFSIFIFKIYKNNSTINLSYKKYEIFNEIFKKINFILALIICENTSF